MTDRTPISTEAAPGAIGPYSQGMIAGGLVFVSGQLPIDPATGELVTGDIQTATDRVMANVSAVLGEAGLTLADVVKTTIYLADMDQFPLVNDVYARHVPADPPARACVQVARLPKDAPLEIEAIAMRR
jgi:2-iminobutanoate/2-iminopropanoate deaminase